MSRLEDIIKDLRNIHFEVNTKKSISTQFSFKKFMGLSNLPQGLSVRGGYFFEKILKEIVNLTENCDVIPISHYVKNQLDLVFVNHLTKTIYYFEIKTNIENDSEKITAVKSKMLNIKNNISNIDNIKDYIDYELICGLLCPTKVFNEEATTSKYGKDTTVYSLSDFLKFCSISTDTFNISNLIDLIISKYCGELFSAELLYEYV